MTRPISLTAFAVCATALIATPILAQSHAGHTVTAGDLVLSAAFSRATFPNAQVGGGYLTIENTGSTDDRLIGAASPMAQDVQIHEMAIVNDIMEMRQLVDGVAIPAGETVALAPGGLHLMMVQIEAPFVEGETVPVTLEFAQAGSVEIALEIGTFSQSSATSGAAHDDDAHAMQGGH